MMIMSKLHNIHTKSIDFALAYPQAEMKSVIYIQPPPGIILNNNGEDIVLKLRKNFIWVEGCRKNMVGASVRRP
eukprot:5861524-Ditylum_brightwellii.AAC.1